MKIKDYLKEVKAEMTHVSFPTRKQTAVFTSIVIGLSLIMALYLGLADYVFSSLIGKFFV